MRTRNNTTSYFFLFYFILAACFVAALPGKACAWSHDPTINTPICTASSGQSYPQITSDGSAGAIITWEDFRSGNADIYARRVSASGTPQWTANGVAIWPAFENQLHPTIISDGSGGAIIAWQDYRSGTNLDIYARRVSASGTPKEVLVLSKTGDQGAPKITSDGSGGAIIIWEDYGSGNADIYAQRFDALAHLPWGSTAVAICMESNDQKNPQIISDGFGGAIIAWGDTRSGSANSDIYAQRVNSLGNVQWFANGVPICVAGNSQQYPTITSDGFGGAIIAWEDYRSGNADIYARRVIASTAQWGPNGVPICIESHDQHNPQIISDGLGGAIITWEDKRSTNADIYAQRVDISGTAQWSANGMPICTANNDQENPQIISDGLGGAIITWEDERSGNGDIYARRISALGIVQWTANGVAMSAASENQRYPTITTDGSGGAIIAWHEWHSCTYHDIYAQQIGKDGMLGKTHRSLPFLPLLLLE